MFLPYDWVLTKPPELPRLLAAFAGKPSDAAAARVEALMRAGVPPSEPLPEEEALTRWRGTNAQCQERGLKHGKCFELVHNTTEGFFAPRGCDLYPCFADGAACS